RGWPLWAMLGVAIVVAACVFVAYLGYSIQEASREYHRDRVRRGQEELAGQLAELQAGKTHAIHLYDTVETDALLQLLEGRPEVEELFLELTDTSDVGLASVATMPRLRRLILYGGRHINDSGLEKLAGMSSLHELELRNTRITNDGLRLLHRL